MAKIERFEDLVAWQKARQETEFLRLQSLAVEVAKIVRALRTAVQRQRDAKS